MIEMVAKKIKEEPTAQRQSIFFKEGTPFEYEYQISV